MVDFFDNMDEGSSVNRPAKAFFALNPENKENEKEVHKWVKAELSYLQDEGRDRLARMKKNMALYKGIQYETQETRNDIRDRSADKSRVIPKITVNHLYDLTANRMARIIKYKPAVAILPNNDEFKDKIAAKTTKSLLDHIWYQQKFEGVITPEIARDNMVIGESYLFIYWNPKLGDKHPDSPEEGERVPLLDDNGKPVKDDSGKVIYIEEPINVGDVEYKVKLALEVFPQVKQRWQDVEYIFVREIMSVDAARAKWRDKASVIKAKKEQQFYNFESMGMESMEDKVAVWTMWHKHTESLPKGRMVVFTHDGILENEELPYSHGDLPCERLTDIDRPGELHGYSFFENVKALTGSYNNIVNMILRNEYLCSHPKWMMPAGAANLASLGNDITIVQYKGPQPPVLVQANPTSPGLFQLLEALKTEFQQISGVGQIMRGEPPPGIKAGVALQFLNEQEMERFNIVALKWNEFIRKVAIKTISVCGDFYEKDDGRMVRILGKGDEWKVKFFDVANLSKSYDVKVQNSSALPDSKAARIQYLMDINKEMPGMVPQEQMVELLDLGQSDKFVDVVTVSLRAAEAENEMIMTGEGEPEPEEYEDHIVHWNVHSKKVMELSFKLKTPKSIQEKMINHIMVTEMMMVEKAKQNPAYQEAIGGLKNFPLFFAAQPSETQKLIMEDAMATQERAGKEAPSGLQPAPELPVNPAQGAEPQAEAMPPMPAVEEQAAPPNLM